MFGKNHWKPLHWPQSRKKHHQCLFWREIDNLRCAALDLDPQAKTGLGRVKRMKFQSTFPSIHQGSCSTWLTISNRSTRSLGIKIFEILFTQDTLRISYDIFCQDALCVICCSLPQDRWKSGGHLGVLGAWEPHGNPMGTPWELHGNRARLSST